MKVVSLSELAAVKGGFAPLTDEIYPPYDTRRLDIGMLEIFTPLSLAEHMDAYGVMADT